MMELFLTKYTKNGMEWDETVLDLEHKKQNRTVLEWNELKARVIEWNGTISKKLPSPNVCSQYMRLFKNKFVVKKYNKRYLYNVQDLILL